MNDEIKKFSFDGSEFPVIQTSTPGGWSVLVADICRHLGIAHQSQYRRLNRCVWSEDFLTQVWFKRPSELQRRLFWALDVKRFSMWLATIESSRIRNDLTRAKIEHWQREAADVLEELVFTDPALLNVTPMNGHVYAIRFSIGVVKVGATSNPVQRMETYRRDCARYGVEIVGAWLSGRLVDPFGAEDRALRWCSQRGSLVQGRESFEIDYQDLVDYLTTTFGGGVMLV